MRRQHTITESILPDGYTRLRYIESTGTQYILTNLTHATNLWKWYSRTWSDFTITTYTVIHGLNYVYGNSRIYSLLGTVPCFDYVCNSAYSSVTLNSNVIGIWVDTFEDANSVTVNGITYPIVKNSNTRNERVVLMCNIFNYSTKTIGCGKYARFTIYDGNDNLKLDGYPALRSTDSKPGLYDIVNNVFYTNAGTGEFLYM